MPNKFFTFLNKFKLIVIIMFTLITIFFFNHALKIHIDADFNSIFSQTDNVIYKVEGDFNQEELDLLLSAYGEVEKKNPIKIAQNDIPAGYGENSSFTYPSSTEKQEDLKTRSGLLLMIKSDYFFTPAFLNTLDICLENLTKIGRASCRERV